MTHSVITLRSAGQGKSGRAISSEVIPWTDVHSPSATTSGSPRAISPASIPRRRFSTRRASVGETCTMLASSCLWLGLPRPMNRIR
jgi:hypothetical protein